MTRLAPLLALALLAGCISPPASDADTSPPAGSTHAPAFRVSSDSCDEGGGYVTWNMVEDTEVPHPFVGADVTADVGHPPVTNVGSPIPDGNMSGAYHGTIHCPTYTFDGEERADLYIAWVGGRVHPPAFDPAPVERTYAASAIGVSDPDLAEALAALGIAHDPLLAAGLSFDADLLVSTASYEHHGEVLSAVPVRTLGPKPDERIRIWIMSPTDAGVRWTPLDLVDRGGDHLVASAPGRFDHRVAVAPPLPGVPVHEFSAWALAYRGVARAIEPGPTVDIVIAGDAHHGGDRTIPGLLGLR